MNEDNSLDTTHGDPNPDALNSPALRVGIYARVSTDHQVQEQTIASQVADLEERLRQEQLPLPADLRFIDDGCSGSTLLRPELERLREAAANGQLDRLYVAEPDRLARQLMHQMLLVEELEMAGVEVLFLKNPPAPAADPEARLLSHCQGIFAEYERSKILQRSRRGKLYAARQGRVAVLTQAPWGYRYVPKEQGGGQARYDVVLEQARWVQRMFHWVGVERVSLAEVARRLQAQGLPSPGGKPYWQPSTIHGMLRNPAYCGSAAYGQTRVGPPRPRPRPPRGRERPRRRVSVQRQPPQAWTRIPVPALVDTELFEAAGRQLQENQVRLRTRQAGPRHLLSGLLVCGCCGYAYCAERNRHGTCTYRCTGNMAVRLAGRRICDNRPVPAAALEEAVWEDAKALLSDPHRLEEEYHRRLDLGQQQTAASDRQNHQVQQRMDQVRRGMGRLIDAYAQGLIAQEEFAPRIGAARQQLARLEAELQTRSEQRQQEQEMRLVIGHLEAFVQRMKGGLEQADHATRREVLRMLIRQVEIDQQEVRVVYRVDCRPFPADPGSPGVRAQYRTDVK